MKSYEVLILSYINKYRQISLNELSYEIGINISSLSDIVFQLYKAGYFVYQNEYISLTEKAKGETVFVWDELSYSKKVIREHVPEKFDWNILYIPEKFDTIN